MHCEFGHRPFKEKESIEGEAYSRAKYKMKVAVLCLLHSSQKSRLVTSHKFHNIVENPVTPHTSDVTTNSTQIPIIIIQQRTEK